MRTLKAVYRNGSVQLPEDAQLAENMRVYALVPDVERDTGIDPTHNQLIQEAKREARARVQRPGGRREGAPT